MYELKHIDFSYGDKLVLKDFSLSLPQKGAVCLFGASGLGKTTVLRLIAGLESLKTEVLRVLRTNALHSFFRKTDCFPGAQQKKMSRLRSETLPKQKKRRLPYFLLSVLKTTPTVTPMK